MFEHSVSLPDGRSLACAEYGDGGSAQVLVANHGTASSRLEAAMYDDVFAEMGLRVLAPERPGYGNSTRAPAGRVLADWGADVAYVLDRLRVETFSVSGYSGGGPHALAIAASEPLRERTKLVILVASLAPNQRERSERGADVQRRVADMSWEDFEAWYESDIMNEVANVTPADEAAFADPVYLEAAMATVTEGLKQGSLGDASDQWALCRPWGFELSDVGQSTEIWHGEADLVVPVEHASVLAAGLRRTSVHIRPGEGHFSMGRYVPEIFQAAATRS